MPKECLQGTVVQLLDTATGGVIATLTPNSLGIFDSGCTLPCPSKVIVKPVNPNCTFTPAQKTVAVRCCPKVTKVKFSCDCAGKGGRIVVGVPAECVAGTTVEIFDLSGNPVVSGPLDATGLFDTGCTLKCPASYVVKVSNPNCTFTPSSKVVQVPCCPRFAAVKFDCDCRPARGRILASVSSKCPPGTKIEIYDQNQTLVAAGPVNAAGWFDTKCTLACGQTYTVVATNPNCTVVPASQTVTVPCCPDFATVKFDCDCPPPPPPPPPDHGRIVVTVNGPCITGVIVQISDPSGTIVTSGSLNAQGVFDTGCQLPCPGAYIVSAFASGALIGSSQVTIGCCPDYTNVQFDCPTPQKGRIVVRMPPDCTLGTIVQVIDPVTSQVVASGYPAIVQSPTGETFGEFDTSCTLMCGQTYLVTATNPDCTILPAGGAQVQAGCCPDAATVDFTCDCPWLQPSCVTPPAGMVAWYTFDEPQGTPIYQDIAGSVQNAGWPSTNPVPQAVSGKVNGATYFNGIGNNTSGTGSYIRVPNHPELDFGTGDFSIDVWVNIVECLPTHIYPIVEKYDPQQQRGYSFYIFSDKLNLVMNGTTFSSNVLGLAFNTWYHVAVTVSRPAGAPAVGTFWLNGAPVGTFTPVAGSIDTTNDMFIGSNFLVTSGVESPCEIALDELELFNVALSQADIAAIYQADSAGKCRPNLGRLIVRNISDYSLRFTILDASGNVVYQSGVVVDGDSIDTGCTLYCTMEYEVKATGLQGHSYPSSGLVTVPCCPESAIFYFH
jgi:hypothetical protein